MGIRVIATVPGYYGHFREPGDKFEIADEQAFHGSWMERDDGKTAAKRAKQIQAQTTGNNPAGALPPNPDFDPDLS